MLSCHAESLGFSTSWIWYRYFHLEYEAPTGQSMGWVNCCRPSPVQSFFVSSPAGLMAILFPLMTQGVMQLLGHSLHSLDPLLSCRLSLTAHPHYHPVIRTMEIHPKGAPILKCGFQPSRLLDRTMHVVRDHTWCHKPQTHKTILICFSPD
jgi:hypothetical protein